MAMRMKASGRSKRLDVQGRHFLHGLGNAQHRALPTRLELPLRSAMSGQEFRAAAAEQRWRRHCSAHVDQGRVAKAGEPVPVRTLRVPHRAAHRVGGDRLYRPLPCLPTIAERRAISRLRRFSVLFTRAMRLLRGYFVIGSWREAATELWAAA